MNAPPNSLHFAVSFSQPELYNILVKRLLLTGNAEILFHQAFQRLEQRDGMVTYWIKDQANNHETQHYCQYLIGVDDGLSSVRRSLGIDLQGPLRFGTVCDRQLPVSPARLRLKGSLLRYGPRGPVIVFNCGKRTNPWFAIGTRES